MEIKKLKVEEQQEVSSSVTSEEIQKHIEYIKSVKPQAEYLEMPFFQDPEEDK